MRGKKVHWDPNEPLINPIEDDPSDHILFTHARFWGKPNSIKGKVSESVIKLNRRELLEAREEHIDNLYPLIETYFSYSNSPILQNKALNQIKKFIGRDKPYSACLKAFAKQMDVPI